MLAHSFFLPEAATYYPGREATRLNRPAVHISPDWGPWATSWGVKNRYARMSGRAVFQVL